MKKSELRTALRRSYQEMSELTKLRCGGSDCPTRSTDTFRCCDRTYCEMTIDYADKNWGVELPRTGHKLPLMSPSGCTALPHLRPWCTLHQCQIQTVKSIGDRE